MKTLTIILMIFISGCTYGKFNRDTNEFTFISTKEFDEFEITYKDGDKKRTITIRAEKVKAFAGQEALMDAVKPMSLEGLF